MKVEVKLYTVEIPSGYDGDTGDYIRGLRKSIGAEPSSHEHYIKWYTPKCSGMTSEEWKAKVEAATPEEIAELQKAFPYYTDTKIQLDETEFLEFCVHVKSPNIREVKRQSINVPTEMANDQFSTQMLFMDQLLALNERCIDQLKRASEISWNEKCQAPVPGSSLVHIDRLMLCESPCTDALQGYLDAGWRIIAACPPPRLYSRQE